MRRIGIAAAMLLLLGAGAAPAATMSVPMKLDGGVYVVPVTLDGVAVLDCIVDSGASDMNIPSGVFQRLVRSGAIRDADYVGEQNYKLADGSSERGHVFRIHALKVGGIEVRDVLASVGEAQSSGLLGQSFLGRFQSWAVDNTRHALVLVGPPAAAPPPLPRVVRGGGDQGDTRVLPTASDVAQTSRHHVPRTLPDDDGAPLQAQGQ